MTHCIVNVATGRYREAQVRLEASLGQFDAVSERELWDALSVGWPTHEANPYAFKAHALNHASSHDLLLWLDASIIAVASLEPLWKKIESDGYWIARNGWNNYQWTADSAYADLFPGMKLEQARELNKRIPHVVATAFGLNLKSSAGRGFLQQYMQLANSGAFRGPWKNTPETPCGPSDVLGHRHDQTSASVIAWRLGMKLTDCPDVFSYPPGSEKTILLAVGA
jgi:hypothetical protein